MEENKNDNQRMNNPSTKVYTFKEVELGISKLIEVKDSMIKSINRQREQGQQPTQDSIDRVVKISDMIDCIVPFAQFMEKDDTVNREDLPDLLKQYINEAIEDKKRKYQEYLKLKEMFEDEEG